MKKIKRLKKRQSHFNSIEAYAVCMCPYAPCSCSCACVCDCSAGVGLTATNTEGHIYAAGWTARDSTQEFNGRASTIQVIG